MLTVWMPVTGVQAQGDGLVNGDEYHLDIDRVLTWDEDWEVDLNLTEYDPATDSDLVVLRKDAATMIFLAEKAEGGEPRDYRDRIVDTALNEWDAEILLNMDDEAGFQAAWIEGSGDGAYGAYYLATLSGDDIITTRLSAPVSEFEDYWNDLQEEVALDDDPLFQNVDGEAAVATIVESEVAESEAPSEGSANNEEDDDSTSREKAPAEAAPADTEREDAGGPAPDLAAAGLVSEGIYESPQFGYQITWEADWDLDAYYDPAVVTDRPDDGADACYLATMDGDELKGYISFEGWAHPFDSVDEYIEFLTSDDNLEETYAGREAEVVLEEETRDAGSYLLKLTNPDTDLEVFVLIQVTDIGDGTAVVTLFSAPTADFLTSLESAQDAITLDDEPVLMLIDNDDIADALES